jgi:hypothetical protein
MTVKPGLPHFIIIGAVKGATTWIHNQLQQHPEIFLPAPEPHYFSQEYDRGLEYYRSLFGAALPGQICGEKSADYFAHPDAVRRLAATLPDARLVLQLRNPVDRAYSDYKMLFRRGTVTGPPETYLDGRENDQPRFLLDGLYGAHLKRWFDYFDRAQLQVLLFEEVMSAPTKVVAAVCDHIGASHHFSAEVGTRPRNYSGERFLPLPLRAALAPLKGAARPLRGKPAFERVRQAFAREIPYPPLSDALRLRIAEYYARDIEQLELLIGRDLSCWRRGERMAA